MCNSNASLTLDLSIYFRLKLVLIKNNDPIYVFPLVIVYSRLYIHVIVGDDLPHLIDNLPRQIIIIFCHYFFSLFLYFCCTLSVDISSFYFSFFFHIFAVVSIFDRFLLLFLCTIYYRCSFIIFSHNLIFINTLLECK